ncbi:hypothetical protein [Paenibacillus elgii]|nr:hypothetical protein [Paenibacillus elgii]
MIRGSEQMLNEGTAAADPALNASGKPYQRPQTKTLGQCLGF